MYLLNLVWFLGTSTLPMCGSTPSKQSRNVPMCLRNLQKKLVHGTLIEAEILTFPLPHVFAQLGLVLGCQCSVHGMPTPPKWSKNVPMHLPKNLVHASTMRSEHNSISEVPTPDTLGVYVLAPDSRGSCASI